MKNFSSTDIKVYDGKNGAPSYVAVEKKVYDVSGSSKWKDGTHMRRHQAGNDLTTDIKSAPHGLEVLDRVTLIGQLKTEAKNYQSTSRATVEALLERHPFFRRHPHPAVVHFPLALLMMSSFLEIMAILTASDRTEWAAYLSLIVGLITVPAAIVTGYFTWWINYESKGSPIINSKKNLAWVVLVVGLVAFLIRTFAVASPLDIWDIRLMVYLGNLLVLSGLVSTIGFLGGKLTFPYE
jgi:predicted heme/steroid binding protein/uncharacterized membrane protein